LGDFVPRRLEQHKRLVQEVVAKAQGEMALEEFLRKTEDGWNRYEVELVAYQGGGTLLVKGWDALFAKLEDDLASLTAMRQSPYYHNVRSFEEQATTWEATLTRAQQTFDLWIDVQRRWVYLGGIFFGAADIKTQVPFLNSHRGDVASYADNQIGRSCRPLPLPGKSDCAFATRARAFFFLNV
jgi:dynein heavy chain 1